MNTSNPRRGFTQTDVNNNRHCRMLLSAIYNVCHCKTKGNSLLIPLTLTRYAHSSSPARGEGNGGFTLIELLVVILIIGILAAVAVPQYQKAVEKSKVVEAASILSTLRKSRELCLLQYGMDAVECDKGENGFFAHLNVDLPGRKETEVCDSADGCFATKNWLYDFDGTAIYAHRIANDDLGDWIYDLWTQAYDDHIYCGAGNDCKQICGSTECSL